MSLDVDQTFASQQKVRALKKSMGPKKGTKYKHDDTVGMHLKVYSEPVGLCMCLDTCCQDEAGCKCKQCACQTGVAHHA